MPADKSDPGSLFAALIFSVDELISLPCHWFQKRYSELRIAAKVMTGYQWDNDHLRITDAYGHEFSLSVHNPDYAHDSLRDKEVRKRFGAIKKGTYRELVLWAKNGQQQVFEATFVADWNEPIPAEIVAGLRDAMSRHSRDGLVRCSDCGVDVDHRKPGGRYFAGTYCPACWAGETGQHKGRGGWEAVEARETYD